MQPSLYKKRANERVGLRGADAAAVVHVGLRGTDAAAVVTKKDYKKLHPA